MWGQARELHIRLVVTDVDAVAGLELAAAELRQRALQARDRRVEFACVQAHDRILAVAAAYAHFRTLSLQQPVEAAHALPEFCAKLFACVEYPRPALVEDGSTACFPVLAALAADGVIADLTEDGAKRSADEQGCAVSFSLERDAAGDWVIAAANADAAPSEETERSSQLAQVLSAWVNRHILRRPGERYAAPA